MGEGRLEKISVLGKRRVGSLWEPPLSRSLNQSQFEGIWPRHWRGDNFLRAIESDPAVSAWIGSDGKVLGFVVKAPDSPTPIATGSFGDVYYRHLWMSFERAEK